MRELRIVFMGTPGFAVGVLEQLVENELHVVGVITAPDKPAGRGRKLQQSAVKEYALSKNLPILQPSNLKDEMFIEQLKEWRGNLQIVVAFRMLPKVVWALPEYGTFNLHASLLPQYRGAAPINWAIIHGEQKTGVTTFFIDEKIDTGAIIDQAEVDVKKDETAGSLHDKLMNTGARLVVKTVQRLQEGPVNTIPQTFSTNLKEAPKLTPENTRINWSDSMDAIDCFIRGLSPYPASWTLLDQGSTPLKTKIYKTSIEITEHSLDIGSIVSDKKEIKVAVSKGFIIIDELQLPGKKKMTAKDLLNGFQFNKEDKFV